ncbi:hypothetical protein ACFVTE_18515 [Arthrobacter sp. NPDC058097]|uniref:hypothetical protein n=1 Tax=Arthrobacter sp. NPDC058097 TaxID=3346340 RepID=UPI0036DDEB54
MRETRNVAWDGRLEAIKGRDTGRYVTTAAAVAPACAACQGPLQANDPLSLSVDISESTAPDGTEYVTFRDYVCHRHCSSPSLTMHKAPWRPPALTPLAARLILIQRAGPGNPKTIIPTLAYTQVPVVSFRDPGGELTSALVSVLLSHGFQLALSPDYYSILEQATDVEGECSMTVTSDGLISLNVAAETIYSKQLYPMKPTDTGWLKEADRGSVLVIAGDNLVITERLLDLAPAAAMGTLVIGKVPVRS